MKLMKNVTESLAGRSGIIKMLGLSLRELTGNIDHIPFTLSQNKSITFGASQSVEFDTLINYIHKGFYPELHESPCDLKDWSDFYSSYFQTYIEKDIKDILKIQDESAFLKFIKAIAAISGQMLNYSTIAEICGKDVKTVKSWTSVLESSGLVYILEPYYNNINKRMIKTPKLYFLDTGLICWLLGWNTPEQMINGAMWGHIFESYIFSEIIKSYYNDGIVNPSLYYYRDKEKNEIDLIIEEGDTLYPIEIKTTSDPKPHMVKAFHKIDTIQGKTRGIGVIICLAKQTLPLTEDVYMLPASNI